MSAAFVVGVKPVADDHGAITATSKPFRRKTEIKELFREKVSPDRRHQMFAEVVWFFEIKVSHKNRSGRGLNTDNTVVLVSKIQHFLNKRIFANHPIFRYLERKQAGKFHG